jgi:hypothetical protein
MRSTMIAVLLASAAFVATDAHAQPKQPQPATGDKQPAAGTPAAGTPAAGPTTEGGGAVAATTSVDSNVPVNIRLRQLEQRVQALKERAWRAKARVEMLKEAVLGGGIGSRAGIWHVNKMGNSYRLIQLVYALDGTTIFTRKDDSGALHDMKNIDVLSGPVTPGSHTLSVLAIYRGHGYGVFKYLKKYKFTVRSSHTFTVDEGKGLSIKVVGFEKGGATTPLEQRPALDFQVNVTKE